MHSNCLAIKGFALAGKVRGRKFQGTILFPSKQRLPMESEHLFTDLKGVYIKEQTRNVTKGVSFSGFFEINILDWRKAHGLHSWDGIQFAKNSKYYILLI